MTQHLTIIGTSHISPDSIKDVQHTIRQLQPDIVAIELDKQRLHALTKGEGRASAHLMIKKVGIQGYLFALIGAWIMKKLSKHLKTQPGSDMLTAIHEAHKIKARVALIDQNIEITLRTFSQQLTWKEKTRLAWDIISSPFNKQHPLRFNIATVPNKELIKKLLRIVKVRYPNIYDVLVHQRNIIMGRRLAHLIQQHPEKTIVAVVGAGHEDELQRLVQKYLRHEQ